MRKFGKVVRERRKYPEIICDDKELLSDIGCWLGIKNRIKEEFGKILLSLGFNVSDEIVLCKYDKKNFSFTYIVNGRNPYKKNIISLDCGLVTNEPKIAISTGSRKTRELSVYRCFRDKRNRIDNKFILICKDKKLSNGVIYRCIYSSCDVKIEIEYPDNYSLIIGVTKLDNGMCMDKNYKLMKEDKLIDYLVNLKMPINMEEFYKNISDICFEFNNILTKVSIFIRNFNENILDRMEIQYGELVEMVTIKDGERIVLYGDIENNLEKDVIKSGARVLAVKGRNNYVWNR